MTTLKNVAIIANTMNGIGINAKSLIAKWTLVPVVHATKNEAKRNSTIGQIIHFRKSTIKNSKLFPDNWINLRDYIFDGAL